jgi:hypothetical protein
MFRKYFAEAVVGLLQHAVSVSDQTSPFVTVPLTFRPDRVGGDPDGG